MANFKLISDYKPTGDQPEAIKNLIAGLKKKESQKKQQTLLGVTGSGKTFAMANVIENVNRPTLILSHNKTLAAQLYGEFKAFFPENAVEYFVSYYDYYQPEAYVPSSDTYIDKDSAINEEIDRLRHSATASLIERRDVIIVASVSCIYGLGSPFDYKNQMVSIREKAHVDRDEIIRKLINIQYTRNDVDLARGNFRVQGDILDIYQIAGDNVFRVEFFGDEIESIKEVHPLTGNIISKLKHIAIFPASYYVTPQDKLDKAVKNIEQELIERIAFFEKENKLLEKQRISERTKFDLEMLKEIGTCKGIENYSRHLSLLPKGSKPFTLLDYFPDDFLTIIDESHAMIPQLRGMYNGDRARKTSLVDYGFRLPSALDNRPLNFNEFNDKIGDVIYVSATPAEYEIKTCGGICAELVIRPTGLLDPPIQVVKTEGQINRIIEEIKKEIKKNGKVFITTLTKKMAEDLTDYLLKEELKVSYMHSDVKTLEREDILQSLRLGEIDVLVGINLLREGLDVPEVSLVIILDADKQGFLRTETSLMQTVGRAARNIDGRVLLFADSISPAMKKTIDETERRRKKQSAYNKKNNITPQSIKKALRETTRITEVADEIENYYDADKKNMTKKELQKLVASLEEKMKAFADEYKFEEAALLRDKILDLKAGK